MLRSVLQRVLRRFGYQLIRNTRPKARIGTINDVGTPVPEALASRLRPDNPRLLELRERYRRCELPMFAHTWWTQDYVNQTLDLRYFRGDNLYLWQKRHMAEAAIHRYFLYASDVAARDRLELFSKLGDDAAFGCWVQRFRRFPGLSRDLLDSVNELNFLDRHAGLANLPELSVLDIGAGYGRLAHRSVESLPNLKSYYCVDAVAESTVLSEIYLDYRGCSPKARVVPGDEVDALVGTSIDLAINVHSFSEMGLAAIEGWLGVLDRLRVPRLFVVPNDAEAFLSVEADGTRHDFLGAIEAHGYRQVAKEPVIADADVRELVGATDHLFLFQRRR